MSLRMKKTTTLFSAIIVSLFAIALMKIVSYQESNKILWVWKGIRSLQESIQSKSLPTKNLVNIKASTKFLKKSYKFIIAGGASLTFAANTIINLKKKKDV